MPEQQWNFWFYVVRVPTRGPRIMSIPYKCDLESARRDWRELAIEHLPSLREVILAATSHIDLWKSLLERLSEAGTDESRKTEVEAIYEYAWWCVAISGDNDLAVEVGTFFYEDLSFYTDYREQAPLFITPSQFQQLDSYFRYRPTDEEYANFRSRFFVECVKGRDGK